MGIRTNNNIQLRSRAAKTVTSESIGDKYFDVAKAFEIFPERINSVGRAMNNIQKCPEFVDQIKNIPAIIKNLSARNSVRHAEYTESAKGDYFEDLMSIRNTNMAFSLSIEEIPAGDYSIWFSMTGPEQPNRPRKKENLGRLYVDHETGTPRLVCFYHDMLPFLYYMTTQLFKNRGRIKFPPLQPEEN